MTKTQIYRMGLFASAAIPAGYALAGPSPLVWAPLAALCGAALYARVVGLALTGR